MTRPRLQEFFEHAIQNAGRPPFVRPRFRGRPRSQQRNPLDLPHVVRIAPDAPRQDKQTK
jgi:hypothetical protein